MTGVQTCALPIYNTSLNSSDFLFIPELFCTESPIPGDIEPDGDVDLKDFAIFSEAWLAEEGQNRYVPACDIDSLSDGIINMEDVAVFVQHWMVSD